MAWRRSLASPSLRVVRRRAGLGNREIIRATSSLQPRLFEVQVALDAVHGFVADLALVAQPDQGLALHPKQLSQQTLEGGGAVLDLGLAAVGARGEPAAAVVVEPAREELPDRRGR